MPGYFRVPTQSVDPGFIGALAALVRHARAQGPGLCSFAGRRTCPRPHGDCPHARAGARRTRWRSAPWPSGMTIGFFAHLYPWTKAFHVIAVIAWMAGMFYLPRLYVYHCDVRRGSVESERFKVMERRLMKQIVNPAMIAAWTFGVMLALTPGVLGWSDGWWWVKLAS